MLGSSRNRPPILKKNSMPKLLGVSGLLYIMQITSVEQPPPFPLPHHTLACQYHFSMRAPSGKVGCLCQVNKSSPVKMSFPGSQRVCDGQQRQVGGIRKAKTQIQPLTTASILITCAKKPVFSFLCPLYVKVDGFSGIMLNSGFQKAQKTFSDIHNQEVMLRRLFFLAQFHT